MVAVITLLVVHNQVGLVPECHRRLILVVFVELKVRTVVLSLYVHFLGHVTLSCLQDMWCLGQVTVLLLTCQHPAVEEVLGIRLVKSIVVCQVTLDVSVALVHRLEFLHLVERLVSVDSLALLVHCNRRPALTGTRGMHLLTHSQVV